MITTTIENIAETKRENEKNKKNLSAFAEQLKKKLEKYSHCELIVHGYDFGIYVFCIRIDEIKRSKIKFLKPKMIKDLFYAYFETNKKLSEQILECEFSESLPKKMQEIIIRDAKNFAEKSGFSKINFTIH